MSRRCDREGAAWPRVRGREARFLRDYGSLDALRLAWRWIGTARAARTVRSRREVMAHLRERPLLPPWWTQEMIDAMHARARELRREFGVPCGEETDR